MLEVKSRKVFQVAKELKLASPTIIEFLETQGHAVDKRHMSPVTQEMYEEIVKKFDQHRWNQYQTELLKDKEEKKRAHEEKLRQEELRKILEKKEEEPKKIKLPQYTPPVEVYIPEEEEAETTELKDVVKEAAEAAAVAEEVPPKKKAAEVEKEKKPKPAVEAKKEEPKKPTEKRRRRRRGARRAEPEAPAAGTAAKKPPEKKAAIKDSRRKRRKRKKVDIKEVEASIRQTMAAMDTTKARRKHKKTLSEDGIAEEENILHLTEFITTQELANMMDVDVAEIIRQMMDMGQLISINQRLDQDTIEVITSEYEFQVEFVADIEEELEIEEIDPPESLKPRSPVVTVMGHVDHGKTSLLDYLRESSIISGESGGITQHIGAYEVKHNDRLIAFLDTPGHEAFTAMRARGAQATDIVILVIAADDRVMPQTVEAIDHARSADVPIVIAINKIDKANADPDMVKKELADHNILVEDWGGKYQAALISAKTGEGIDQLLEELLLAADMLELKANPDRLAKGVIIESMIDKGRGIISTVLIQNGTLNIGSYFHSGQQFGRVRAMFDETGKRVKSAGPSTPVQITGFSGPPRAGDTFVACKTEKEAKTTSMRRQQLQREQSMHRIHKMTLDRMSSQISAGVINELPLIVKGDVDGSVQAVCDSLMKLSRGEVKVNIVHRGVGAISESDVLLAQASSAVIIGFHVHPNIQARKTAILEDVEIRLYKVIYDVVNDISETLEGMLTPDTREDVVGLVEIREVFKIPRIGTIAGCHVVDGAIERTKQVRLLRDGHELFKGSIASLRPFKDDVKEVKSGFECGIRLDGYDEIKEGDSLEVVEIVEVQRKLADVE